MYVSAFVYVCVCVCVPVMMMIVFIITFGEIVVIALGNLLFDFA